MHINAIGSYRPDMVEIPAETINRAKNVVDARNAVLSEAGDFVQPIEAGLFGPDVVHGEIGEIAAGRLPGRLDFSEITLFKSVGNAVQDLATAGRIIKLAEENDFGILLDILLSVVIIKYCLLLNLNYLYFSVPEASPWERDSYGEICHFPKGMEAV